MPDTPQNIFEKAVRREYMTTREIGEFGEIEACSFLEKKGIQIIKRNYSCRTGEIDIIAKDGDVYIFCEVKTRVRTDFGTAGEFVDYKKQERIIKTALYYTMRDDLDMRFDVIEVYYRMAGDCIAVTGINHIENAF